MPEDVEELISVDMGCVGEGLRCTEREVSICAKDSGGPYDYKVTTALVEAAQAAGAAYAVDVYPHYGRSMRKRPFGLGMTCATVSSARECTPPTGTSVPMWRVWKTP